MSKKSLATFLMTKGGGLSQEPGEMKDTGHPRQQVPLELTLEKQEDGKENHQHPLRLSEAAATAKDSEGSGKTRH